MTQTYQIAMLWIGGALSYLELLCLKSFVACGHQVTLFSYAPVRNLPDGVLAADAVGILPREGIFRHKRTDSPALHSDLFRYRLLAQRPDMIWADADAYCLRPFVPNDGYLFAWEGPHGVNGGVLALPQNSAALQSLLGFTADPFAIPPWLEGRLAASYRQKQQAGDPVHASDMKWGVWGPHALSHFLRQTGEIDYALPQKSLYPIAYKDRNALLRSHGRLTDWVGDETISIHFYGRRLRAKLCAMGGMPKRGSILAQLLQDHEIDPHEAPLSVLAEDIANADAA